MVDNTAVMSIKLSKLSMDLLGNLLRHLLLVIIRESPIQVSVNDDRVGSSRA